MAMIRAIRRNYARNQMIEAGYTGINHKTGKENKSQFSKLWREFLSRKHKKRESNGRRKKL